MENEIWKNVSGYEGLYEVSSEGRVRSLKWGKTRVLKPWKDRYGYLQVSLYKDGKKMRFAVHRLVAEAFIDNPLNKPQVNHKTEDKTQNSVNCLEWVTNKENCNFGTRTERSAKARSKQVLQFTKEEVFVKEFPSTKEAERQTGINQSNICQCCLGRYKSVGGYVWKYKLSR